MPFEQGCNALLYFKVSQLAIVQVQFGKDLADSLAGQKRGLRPIRTEQKYTRNDMIRRPRHYPNAS